MKDLLFDRFSNFIAAVKRLPIARLVVVLFASVMMLVSTACSNATPSASSGTSPSNPMSSGTSRSTPMSSNPPTPVESGEGSYHAKSNANQPTELYDPIQKPEGGMNVYSDTDPRYQRGKLGAEIENRVDDAERNLDRSIEGVDDYVDNYTSGAPLGERIRNITDRVGKATGNVTDDVQEGADRGSQNLKVNAKRAERNANDAVQGVADDTANNARDLGRKAGRVIDDVTDRT